MIVLTVAAVPSAAALPLLLAAWAAELKIATTATQSVGRRGGDRPSLASMRRVVGVLHLILLILGAACAIALPGPMLMAVFVGAVLSIPAIYALYNGPRVPSTIHAGLGRPGTAAFRGRFAPPQN